MGGTGRSVHATSFVRGLLRMIKLALSDMDGCMVDDAGRLPADFDEVAELAARKGVLLGAASGRIYEGTAAPFGAAAAQMAFISDNGSCVYVRGKRLFAKTAKRALLEPVAKAASAVEGAIVVGCGVERTWIERRAVIDDAAYAELKKYYPTWTLCDNVLEVPDELIKLALLHMDGVDETILPEVQGYDGGGLAVRATARVWIDAFDASVSKGTGVAVLQRELGISPSETVVFGDYLNDLPMADFAARSFAPVNAHAQVKERFTDVMPGTNNDGIVTKTLRELLVAQPDVC